MFKTFFILFISVAHLSAESQNKSTEWFKRQLKNKDLNDSLAASYYLALGKSSNETSPSEELKYFSSALEAAKKSMSITLLYESFKEVSAALKRLSRINSALVYAKSAHELAERMKKKFFIYEALNHLGNLELEKLTLKKAKDYFDKALGLSLQYPEIGNKSNIYRNLSNYYYRCNQPDKGINIIKTGIEIAKKEENFERVMLCYTNLGSLFRLKSKIDSATHYLFTALDYFSRKGNVSIVAYIHQNLALAYGRLNNLKKMKEHLEISFAGYKSIGDEINAAGTLLLAVPQLLFRDNVGAEEFLRRSEPIIMENQLLRLLAISYLYRASLNLIKDTATARNYFFAAKAIARRANIPNIDSMIKRLEPLMTGKYENNTEDQLIDRELASLKNAVHPDQLKLIFETISADNAFAKKNKQDILNVFKKLDVIDSSRTGKIDSMFIMPSDSTLLAVYNRQLQEMETKYHTRQKEDSILMQSNLITIKNRSITTRNYFLTGLGILILSILLLFIRSRNQEKRITLQYNQINQLQTELKHRTGNFFNSINGMLVTASHLTTDKETIHSLSTRVATINRLYKTLYASPEIDDSSFDNFLQSICTDFQLSFGNAKTIQVISNCNAKISREESIPLAFIITELLTNAEKYAFNEKKDGEIHIDISSMNGKRILHVWDNGGGKSESAPVRKGSQGMAIMKSYAKNLNGKLDTWNENGYHIKMEF